jgi:lipoprotein NlpD
LLTILAQNSPMHRTALLVALLAAACATDRGEPMAIGDEPTIAVPAPQALRTHRAGANETLLDIAIRYQIPLRSLIEQNRLAPPYELAAGAIVRLPPPRFHIVRSGESFEDVARLTSMDPRSLALLNHLQPPYRVSPGDRLALPALASVQAPPQPPTRVAGGTPAVHAGGARFNWPLRGEIVARFGAQTGGARLDGIEIAGREGARVLAAAEGDVVYAGDDLPAYGTLVLVRHGGNYVTAYAHGRRALVREGQHVRAGEPVAELGGARLLFQVRHGAQPVDPAPLLGR